MNISTTAVCSLTAVAGLAVSTAAFGQTDRLPPPPPSGVAAPTFTFADAYRTAGRPIVAVVDCYIPDRTHPANDQSVQAALLGARTRDFFRSSEVLMVSDDLAGRAGRDASIQALAPTDARAAARLIADQTRAEVVVALVVEARTATDNSPQLRASYEIVDTRRDALVGGWVYDISPAAGRPTVDADRVASFAGAIGADAQQRFTNFYREGAASPIHAPTAPLQTASRYSQPLDIPPPAYTPPVVTPAPMPSYVQPTPTYVESAPVAVPPPVAAEAVPASWSIGLGYGWGGGSVALGYSSGYPAYYPGYVAAPYYPYYPTCYRPAYCAPYYGGWGYPAFALSLNFASGHSHGHYHGGGSFHGGHHH